MRWFFRHPVPKYAIGIDFGTTTTRLCYVDNTQEVINIPQLSVTPVRSVVTPFPKQYGKGKYEWQVGENVINTQLPHYSLFKLEMGSMKEMEIETDRSAGTKIAMRPEILAAEVMLNTYARAVKGKGDLSEIRDVTITVPAEWNAIERQATIMAGKIAGFSNITLIEEPVAAYLAIRASGQSDIIEHAKNVLVFDYGGGTLDVTVIHRPDSGPPYVVGRSMSKGTIAGEAIDIELAKREVGDIYWKKLSLEDRGPYIKRAAREISSDKLSNQDRAVLPQKLAAEHYWNEILDARDRSALANIFKEMKEALNPDPSRKILSPVTWPDEIRLPSNTKVIAYEKGTLQLSREILDEVLTPKIAEAMVHIDAAIKNSSILTKKRGKIQKITSDDIGVVLLVGGSSNLRMVQDEICSYFHGLKMGDGIYLVDPEKIVAIGAALYKSYLDRRLKKFELHVPMHTYLEYQTDKINTKRLALDDDKDGRLPLTPKPPKTCPIPSDIESINWNVYQEYSYGGKIKRVVVESIRFENPVGKLERLRLEYTINQNGILEVWRPLLIIKQNKPVRTSDVRYYDWADKNPTLISDEYGLETNVGSEKT